MPENVPDDVSPMQWGWLADAVLGVHIGIAVSIVLGQLAILAGGFVGAQQVRNFKFLLTHLLLIVFAPTFGHQGACHLDG